MLKRISLVLVLAAIAAGGAFAQDSSPKHTITVDFGPTIIGVAIGAVGNALIDDEDDSMNASGFGIAAQYEYQLMETVTLGGRFAYLSGALGFSTSNGGVSAMAEASISSFSLEGHARYYPFSRRTFFLDGMLGYASLSLGLGGAFVAEDDDGHYYKEAVDFSISRGYLKYGAKLGWRIDFGKPGGFIFEPSFGYYGGFGLSDTFGKQLVSKLDGDINDISDIDDIFSIIEDYIFIGGPRFSLSFGWRF